MIFSCSYSSPKSRSIEFRFVHLLDFELDFNSNYCSDGEQQLVIKESFEKTDSVSTNVPPTKYEIRIGASQKGDKKVILLVTDVVTRMDFIETIQA